MGYEELNKIKLHTEKKGNQKLTYASWAEAWGTLKGLCPGATFKVYEDINGMPYFHDTIGAFVKVGVIIDNVEHISHLPVMNNYNKGVAVADLDTFTINKNIQRALVKAIAMHGLGLYVYQGEDFPEE